MKSSSGKGMVIMCISIIIIIILAFVGYHNIKKTNQNSKIEDIKSNMLSIQGACKVLEENSIIKKDNSILVGTMLSQANDSIITDFKNKKVLNEEDYSKYYLLTDNDLQTLKLDFTNEPNSYYIVNYESGEVIITSGCQGKYRLSEIQ